MSEHDEVLNSVELSRRSFMKKLIAVGFAVPVISSFALDGIAGASYNPGQGEGALGGNNLGTGQGDLGESNPNGTWGHPNTEFHFPHSSGNITTTIRATTTPSPTTTPGTTESFVVGLHFR